MEVFALVKYRTDARHGQHRVHPATRLLILRTLGVGIGFLLALPLFFILFGMP